LKIKYDIKLMHFMSLFAKITHASLKDCFLDKYNLLTFIVNENEIGKAIGKKGFKVKLLEKSMNRKIKIVEFNPDMLSFTRNIIYPLRTKNIEGNEKVIIIEAMDSKTRGLLIGRGAENLRNYEGIVKRYFDISEIKVK